MNYTPLKKYFYVDKEKYLTELEQRLHSYGTLFFPITIKPYRSQKENPAFLVCTWEMMMKIEKIMNCLSIANKAYERLPHIARTYYISQCLINEIQTTNDIEGIFSTRKEIKDTIDSLSKHKDLKKKRFSGMIDKYSMLLDGEYVIPLQSSSDILSLYNDIVKDEVDAQHRPDGKLFRKDTVFVVSKTHQRRHEGVNPEERIIEYMDTAISILHNDSLPSLIKIAVFHYFFGYIHPFYDGNGRINRFISSYLLSKTIDPLIAYDLSYIVKKNRDAYYRAFRICNEEKNKGDITPFVTTFIDFIEQAAEYISGSLLDGIKKLSAYGNVIEKMKFSENAALNDSIKRALQIFIQNALFTNEPFVMDDLKLYLERSRNVIIDIIKHMTEFGLPITFSKDSRKITYRLDLDAFDEKYM